MNFSMFSELSLIGLYCLYYENIWLWRMAKGDWNILLKIPFYVKT